MFSVIPKCDAMATDDLHAPSLAQIPTSANPHPTGGVANCHSYLSDFGAGGSSNSLQFFHYMVL